MIKKDKMKLNPAIKVSQNKIYIYETPNNLDTKGFLKIGQTERDSEDRILNQTGTAMVRANILAEYEAVDDNGQVFSDKEIHQFLLRKGIENLKHYGSGKSSEWFKIGFNEIDKVIKNRQHFIDDFEFLKDKPIEIQLYPSQQEALNQTYSRWKVLQENPNIRNSDSNIQKFLWNAKPRFGKTLTAYKFAEKIQAKNVLIMTQRASISNSWFSDYDEYIRNSKDSNYEFGSSKDNRIENEETVKAQALDEKMSERIAYNENKSLIYYTTLANIKGKDESGEFKKKNAWIFNAHWDLVILDETHEGTITDAMTKVLESLNHDFLLELSGTPFRKMTETQGYTAKNTYSWSYIEEQEAKENWDYSQGKNPYINLPKLNMYTFQVPSNVRVTSDLSKYSFDFNEFWKISADKFIHEQEIDTFLDILSNQKEHYDDPQTQYYPFADKDTREQLRHTLWKLPSTAAVKLLAKKLRIHEFFSQYKVIEAAGSKEGRSSIKAEKEVKAAIGDNGLKTKTITLSVDMLTTGTTVEEWTAVLMLDNTSDTGRYIQTAFRAQTPWRATFEDGTTFVKTNAFVFDFNPDRVLKIAEDYANMDIKTGVEVVGNSSGERKLKTQMLINFMPIIAMDENSVMRYIDAKDAVNIINYTTARKIVDGSFMSNSLFNVKALFRLKDKDYERVREIMSEISPVSSDKRKNKKQQGKPLAEENPEDTFEIKKEKVISQSGLGEKKFAVIEEANSQGDENLDLILEKATEQAGEEITKEDLKKFKQVKNHLDEVREKKENEEKNFQDHLQGFSRAVPIFLMAYAHDGMTFEDLEEQIPPADFKQVTGITKEQFKYLRQVRDDSGEPIFVESTFNSAIHEFLKRKRAIEYYYKSEAEDDIYDNIPSQENNRIFTPKRVVNMMLDAFEAKNPDFFKSDKVKILDQYVKSGNFLAEAAKRFYKYSKDKDIKRIIENQLFGIAPLDIYATLAQETVYGFADTDFKYRLRNRNIRTEPQIEELVKAGKLEEVIKEHFGNMKFDVVIGNPPYQEEKGKTEAQNQANTTWIYHYFQNQAEKIADKTALIYPFGGWFDNTKAFKGFGRKILSDGHTVSINAFEGTNDKRAWYRIDKKPEPIFKAANLSAGVAIVLRDNLNIHDTYTYSNRVYSDSVKVVNRNDWDKLSPSPDFAFSEKLFGKKLESRIKKGIFGIESNFVENNPSKVSFNKADWDNPIILYTNDKSGSAGRAKKYWTDISTVQKGCEFINKYKVVSTSAYPKKTFSSGKPTVDNVLRRLSDLVEILPSGSAFGSSKLALFMSSNKDNCDNFIKYTQTRFFAYLTLQEPNRRSSFGCVIPDQNFTSKSDIDWSQSIAQIDQQLYKKYGLSEKEIAFIEEKVRAME